MEDRTIRTFNFYEFVGILVPGVLFLFGVEYLVPADAKLKPLLLPDNLGTATIHLVLAYAVGHLVVAAGDLLTRVYWNRWGGTPTDWPYSRPNEEFPKSLVELVRKAVDSDSIQTIYDWRRAVATARARVIAKGLSERLLIFNGNYGMFRGMAAVGILFLATAWYFVPDGKLATYVVLVSITLLSVYRMHRFARHYGAEFFACVSALKQQTEKAAPGSAAAN